MMAITRLILLLLILLQRRGQHHICLQTCLWWHNIQ